MNALKIQFNTLIFKMLVLALIVTTIIFTETNAQQLINTSYTDSLYINAKVFYQSGNFSYAIKNLNEILLIKNKNSKDISPEYFKLYNRFGIVYKKQGNLKMAIEFYKKALENTRDVYYISIINGNIANIYTITGDNSKAISYIGNSLTVLEKSSDEKKYYHLANNYHNIGAAYDRMKEYTLALKNYFKSIQIAEEKNLGGIEETYYNCGLVYKKIEEFNKADLYFKKAINSYLKSLNNSSPKIAMAYINQAFFYSEIG